MPESPDDNGQMGASPDLDRRLEEARRRNQPATTAASAVADDGMGIGVRSGIEFLAAILVSVGIGLGLDKWLHTAPAALLIMMALGFAAGLLNVYRAMKGMGYGETYKKRPGATASASKDKTDET